jgi:iron(III) transport system substrate-binding protein
MEYPANNRVPANRIVQAWGKFRQDDMNLAQAGKLQAQAVKLMDRAGYK